MSWMKFYYANPTPDRLASELREAFARGELEKPEAQLVWMTFLGRIMAALPHRIAAWFAELADVTGSARMTLHGAAWMSGAGEGQDCLHAVGADPRMFGPAPDLLAQKLEPVVLDLLWATYFASGDEGAVRRVIGALDFLGDRGAAARFATSAKTDDDRARAINDAMFQAASWSLGALMQEHAPLIAVCERIFETATLSDNERILLAITLQKAAPDVWDVKIDPAAGSAVVNRRRR